MLLKMVIKMKGIDEIYLSSLAYESTIEEIKDKVILSISINFYDRELLDVLTDFKEDNKNVEVKELNKSYLIKCNDKAGFIGKFIVENKNIINLFKKIDDFECKNGTKFIERFKVIIDKKTARQIHKEWKERKEKKLKDEMKDKIISLINNDIKRISQLINDFEQTDINEAIEDIKTELHGADWDYAIAKAYWENYYDYLNWIDRKQRVQIAENKDKELLKNELKTLINEAKNALSFLKNLLKNVEANNFIVDVHNKQRVKIDNHDIEIHTFNYIDEEKFLYEDEAFAIKSSHTYLIYKDIKNKFLKGD